MTETKRCIPCVEKKLRQLYQRERNKTEMYRRRIDELEKENKLLQEKLNGLQGDMASIEAMQYKLKALQREPIK